MKRRHWLALAILLPLLTAASPDELINAAESGDVAVLRRLLDAGGRDLVVRDRADGAGAGGEHAHAFLLQGGDQFRRAQARRDHVKVDDVGFVLPGVQLQTGERLPQVVVHRAGDLAALLLAHRLEHRAQAGLFGVLIKDKVA